MIVYGYVDQTGTRQGSKPQPGNAVRRSATARPAAALQHDQPQRDATTCRNHHACWRGKKRSGPWTKSAAKSRERVRRHSSRCSSWQPPWQWWLRRRWRPTWAAQRRSTPQAAATSGRSCSSASRQPSRQCLRTPRWCSAASAKRKRRSSLRCRARSSWPPPSCFLPSPCPVGSAMRCSARRRAAWSEPSSTRRASSSLSWPSWCSAWGRYSSMGGCCRTESYEII